MSGRTRDEAVRPAAHDVAERSTTSQNVVADPAAPAVDTVLRAEHEAAVAAARAAFDAELAALRAAHEAELDAAHAGRREALRAQEARFEQAWIDREQAVARGETAPAEPPPAPRPTVRRARVTILCRGGRLDAGAEIPADFDLTGVGDDAVEEG